MSLTRYLSPGFRAVWAESMTDAAEVFATRAARRVYGRKGYARTLCLNSWTQDGRLGEYNSFVGYRSGLNETTGHNIHLTVFRD